MHGLGTWLACTHTCRLPAHTLDLTSRVCLSAPGRPTHATQPPPSPHAIACHTVPAAAAFCLDVQYRLLETSWPANVLKMRSCRPAHSARGLCCAPPSLRALEALPADLTRACWPQQGCLVVPCVVPAARWPHCRAPARRRPAVPCRVHRLAGLLRKPPRPTFTPPLARRQRGLPPVPRPARAHGPALGQEGHGRPPPAPRDAPPHLLGPGHAGGAGVRRAPRCAACR